MRSFFKLANIHKLLFYILIFLLPLNLGKHFEIKASYVNGLLIDYLVPTLYLQDILVVFLFVFWGVALYERRLSKTQEEKTRTLHVIFNKPEIQYLCLFLFSVFLSVLAADRFLPAFAGFLRTCLYSLVFVYILLEFSMEKDLRILLRVLAASVFLVSLLGVLQFFKQGSWFDNYMFFGEQPYTTSTKGISLENVFGRTVVGSYGLFRHPNAFAGYLCLSLTLLLFFIKKKNHFMFTIFLGGLALIFTFSYITYVIFVLAVGALFFIRHIKKLPGRMKKLLVAFVFLAISYYSLSFIFFDKVSLPSLSRRAELLRVSYTMLDDHFLFGVGVNNFTSHVDSLASFVGSVRFTQPVHNIFILILTESGVFALIFFACLVLCILRKQIYSKSLSAVFLPLLCFIVLGCFDHYFLTMHQTQLLMWLTLGLASRQAF